MAELGSLGGMNAIEPKRASRRKRLIFGGVGILTLCVAFGVAYHLPSPDGIYYDPYVGCIGDAHWVFQDGEFHMTTPESDDLISRYSKEGEVWVYRGADGSTGKFTFTATMVGIRIHDSSNNQGRFLFRRSFAWLPKTWSWIQLYIL